MATAAKKGMPAFVKAGKGPKEGSKKEEAMDRQQAKGVGSTFGGNSKKSVQPAMTFKKK